MSEPKRPYRIGLYLAMGWLALVVAGTQAVDREPSSDLSLANVPPSDRWTQRVLQPAGAHRSIAIPGAGGLLERNAQFDDRCSASSGEGRPTRRLLRTPNRTAVEGVAYGQRVVPASGSRDAPITACLVSGPTGLSVADGWLRWDAEQVTRGAYPVEIFGHDGDAGELLRFTLTVADKPYLLGTDRVGRSVLTVLRIGAFWALSSAVLFTFWAMGLGALIGSVAGYFRRAGMAFDWLSNAVESVPIMLAFFVVAVISGFEPFWIAVIGGAVMAPRVAGAVRQQVEELAAREFVEAAQELGESPWRVVALDIVRYNLLRPLAAAALGILSFAIVLEVTLSYLRIGVQAPDVSWGTLLLESRSRVPSGELWGFVVAVVVVLCTVGALNFLAHTVATRR